MMPSNCEAGPWSLHQQENLFYNLKECEGLPLGSTGFPWEATEQLCQGEGRASRGCRDTPVECLVTNANKRRENQLGHFLSLPLLIAASVLSAAQSVSVSLPATAFYILPAPGAAAPAGAVVSEEPQCAPCSPAAVSGNLAAEWTHQARWQWNCRRKQGFQECRRLSLPHSHSLKELLPPWDSASKSMAITTCTSQ